MDGDRGFGGPAGPRCAPARGAGAGAPPVRSVLLAGLLLACGQGLLDPVTPAVVAEAGADRSAAVGEVVELDGSSSRLAPLEIWLADGSGPNENKLIVYRADRGVETFGPLRSVSGQAYAYPSDLVQVGGDVYGIDTFRGQLYRLLPKGGQVAPIGDPSGYRSLSALAYDARDDVLYVADRATRRLLIADRSSGEIRSSGIQLPGRNVKGLAFDPRARLLYGCDEDLSLLYSVDPSDGLWSSFVALPVEGDGRYDELAHYGGQLYAMYGQTRSGTPYAQLRRIDPETGEAVDVGTAIPNASTRSLLIRSVPEPARWMLAEGPGEARFDAPGALVTRVRFDRPGRYRLSLTIEAEPEPVSDSVMVYVTDATSG